MSESEQQRPLGLYALLLNIVPFLTGLAMLGLKWQIGPKSLTYWTSQVGGFFMFGLMIVGSAFILIATVQTERRDWRIYAATLLLLLTIIELVLFF